MMVVGEVTGPIWYVAVAVLLIGVLGGVAENAAVLMNTNVAKANAFCCAREMRSKRRAGLAANLPKASPAARYIVRTSDALIVKQSITVNDRQLLHERVEIHCDIAVCW